MSNLPDKVWVMTTNQEGAQIVLSYFDGLSMVEWYDEKIGDTQNSSILVEIGRINDDGEFYVPDWVDGTPSVIHDSFIRKVDFYEKMADSSEDEFVVRGDNSVSIYRNSICVFDGSDL